jgi:hypothetical protein
LEKKILTYINLDDYTPFVPTRKVFPQKYAGRRLDFNGHQWPFPHITFHNGEPVLRRTDQGLEGVPGYFQKRNVGHTEEGKEPTKAWVYVDAFQRRRGTGVGRQREGHRQIPLSHGFINSFTNEHIYYMRRMLGMYKLPFWHSNKYTPLKHINGISGLMSIRTNNTDYPFQHLQMMNYPLHQ